MSSSTSKQATTTPKYQGIPIYVDPVGLQEAEKSMKSTVRNMDLEGVPLRRTLQLLLDQIDLAYFVRGWTALYHLEGFRDFVGPFGAGDRRTVADHAEGRQGRARGAFGHGDAGTARASQNPRADHEARGGRAWRRNGADKGNRGRKTRSRTGERLLKEIRGLLDELRAERQKAKAGEKK